LRNRPAALLLAAYLLVLGDLTLIRFPQRNPGRNLVPLRTIRHDLANRHQDGASEFRVNTLGNVAAFLPAGMLPPLIWPRAFGSARRAALGSFGLSLLIELAQLATGRRCADVDDLILNTLGGLIGYGLLRWGRWAFGRPRHPG
jgi:glycopeptide antibiotics resistance protein